MTSYKCVHLVQYTRTRYPENTKVFFLAMSGCSYCFKVLDLNGVKQNKMIQFSKLAQNGCFQVQTGGTQVGVEFVLLVGVKVCGRIQVIYFTPMLFLCPVDSV